MATVLANPWIPHDPTERQVRFLLSDASEAFYGGAAGGGKSDALLMAALQWIEVPGYSAILFRRTFADLALPGALMDRAREWLSGTAARWNERDKRWDIPDGGSLIFGYLEHENNKFRYQSAEFQFVGFDELTQFSETQYRYLFSRLRRLVGSNVPLRMRAASNPGGLGHDWVKQRFITEASPSRPWIRAGLDDNPYLDRESYIKSLMELDPVTRQQLLDGDWTARQPGGLFRREWLQTVEAAPQEFLKVRYWDLAATEVKPGTDPDWTVGVHLTKSSEGVYYVLGVERFRGTPATAKARIKATAVKDGPGTAVWIEQEPGASAIYVIDTFIKEMEGYAVRGNRVTGSKVERAAPVSSQAEAGNIKLVAGPWITDFIDELEAFPLGGHDDQVDGLSGAFMRLRRALPPVSQTYDLLGQHQNPERHPLGLDMTQSRYQDTDRRG